MNCPNYLRVFYFIALYVLSNKLFSCLPTGDIQDIDISNNAITANETMINAIYSDDFDTVYALLESNTLQVNSPLTPEGTTGLMVAASCGRDDILHHYITLGANVNQVDSIGNNALIYACATTIDVTDGLLNAIDELLESNVDSSIVVGPDPDIQNTLLHELAKYPNKDDIIATLGYGGVNIEARNAKQETPLLIATKHNQVKNINALLAVGADINAVNSDGEGCFMIALRLGYYELANDFLQIIINSYAPQVNNENIHEPSTEQNGSGSKN